MATISANYPQPVLVNGFVCRNCTDVDNAKRHIDPAHPKSGPYGIDAATDPTNPKRFIQSGGGLTGTPTRPAKNAAQSTGQLVDIQA
ncbi:MAG TPA: hypothetical protein VMJ11_06120 [Paraburkholderia sp.]|uniref:hypothetical protein n=1 Tax=Paraburkholderia sp. TaxID=1926495 RepID=UPI002D0CC498|nr:hypothetical protein [Paraburkholderia sp.]HTR06228.1 hypothetical protein [Paraburkholderia sp.]HVM84674.1 hypothetical protein [Candidatus Binatia bacterium]